MKSLEGTVRDGKRLAALGGNAAVFRREGENS